MDIGVEGVDSAVGGVPSGPGGDGDGEGQDCDEDLHFVGDVSAAIVNQRLICSTLYGTAPCNQQTAELKGRRGAQRIFA